MKRRTAFLTLLAFGICQSSPAADDDGLVFPGKRIGKISLGMEHAEVMRLLGAPHHEEDLAYLPGNEVNEKFKGVLRDDWITPLPPLPKDESPDNPCFMARFLTVYFKDRRVVQIEVHDPRFKTKDGLSIKSPATKWRAQFPGFKEIDDKVKDHYHHPSSGSWPAYKHYVIFDEVREKGVAWRFGAMGNMAPDPDPESGLETVMVHAPGQPLIMDPDGGSRFIWKDAPMRPSTEQ